MTQTYKKKLIEVAIPLEAINAASAHEKSIRQGHPASLHQWWARRPLAACRAVIFSQLVDDPSSNPEKFSTLEAVEAERKRLFSIVEELVKWENSTNENVLERARNEIFNSCGECPPTIYDPFSGGGAIPLEAMRLGLPSVGTDLNPVAVLIGKTMLEITKRFSGLPPLNPTITKETAELWVNIGNAGLADDLRYYAARVAEVAKAKTKYLYPEIVMPKEYGGGSAQVISWIWARTVASPNPGINHAHVPLVKNLQIANKPKFKRWCKIVPNESRTNFEISISDEPSEYTEPTINRAGATCVLSGEAIPLEYIRREGRAGRLGSRLLAIVADGPSGRVYLPASAIDESYLNSILKPTKPSIKIDHWSGCTNCVIYGFTNFEDLYSPRQFTTLKAFVEAITEITDEIYSDIKLRKSIISSEITFLDGGTGAKAYSEALSLLLSFSLSKLADLNNSFCRWEPKAQCPRNLFGKQAIPMVWDYAESNPFSKSSGGWHVVVRGIANTLEKCFSFKNSGENAQVFQADAHDFPNNVNNPVVCMDPPYYDNIPYSNLSDFFYMWLKEVQQKTFKDLLATLAVPKQNELVANQFRHGDKTNAERFFINGMREVVSKIVENSNEDFPTTIFYAFKQSEVNLGGTSSTGWATFLEAIISAGFEILRTWPMRTENSTRMMGQGNNALASSVVLVCRKRKESSLGITRGEFIRALSRELPEAVRELQSANVTPADMPQSAIGPGIGIFSRYSSISEANDTLMTVKTALELINHSLDEFLNDLHGDFDPDTRFSATWFEQNGYQKGDFGAANSLATARGISVDSVKHAGIIESSAGKVRILKREELDPDWDPSSDPHLTIWECCQYLVREYEEGGETAAAMLIKKMGYEKAEAVKDLAYYLYDICSNKRQDAKEATSYNALIAGWNDIIRMAGSIHDTDTTRQANLF